MVKMLLIYQMNLQQEANGRCSPCNRGWSHWGDECYKTTDVPLMWFEAQEECIKMKGVMAAPNSAEENVFLQSLISTHFWINCNDTHSEG